MDATPARPVCLDIADLKISLGSDDPELSISLPGTIQRFLVEGPAGVEPKEPDASVRARWGEAGPEDHVPLFDSGGLWKLYSSESSYRVHFTSSALGPLPYKVASF